MARKKQRSRKWIAIAMAVLLMGFTVVVVLNLSLGDKTVDRDVPSLYSVEDEQFTRTMSVMLGPALVNGNRTTVLLNGDQIFPAMLEALRSAQKTITFEMYIYWSGRIGKEFADVGRTRARGCQGARPDRRVGCRQDRRGVRRADGAGGGGVEALQPAALLDHRAIQ